MEARLIHINGIYDSSTLSKLNELNVSRFTFDFRPKSFNFIQIHKFLEILDQSHKYGHKYYLKFSNEKEFVITKIISDLKDYIDSSSNLTIESFYLVFDDDNGFDFYEQFQMPYFWHYNESRSFKDGIHSESLQGVILNYNLLSFKHSSNRFNEFVSEFSKVFYDTKTGQKELGLERNWNDDIFPSLEHYFNFDFVTLPIDFNVESSYRNIDYPKLENNILKIQNA